MCQYPFSISIKMPSLENKVNVIVEMQDIEEGGARSLRTPTNV